VGKKIRIALLVIVVIGAIGGGVIYKKLHEKAPTGATAKVDVTMTAEQLAKEFGTDEKAANAKYLNKNIEVSGVVTETNKNQDGGLMVMLETGDPINVVQCTMDSSATAAVNKGDKVTIKGICSGNNMGVCLTGCAIKK